LGISFGSINTGLPRDIVQQIMEAERIPVRQMEVRKDNTNEKRSLVSELIGLVEGVRGNLAQNTNARALREFKVEANEEIVSTTADKNIVEPGSYQFEVLQLAQKSSAMSSGFADKDKSNIGVGFLQYTLPSGKRKEVYVDHNNSSLAGVARLINADSENGMRANVINDGSGSDRPWRLIISLDETGRNNQAQFPHFYFVDGEQDFYLEFERKAQNAKVKLDGFEIELEENRTTDLIPGLTIDLRRASPGDEFSINVTEDLDTIRMKVSELVMSVNDVLQFIKTQNEMDAHTDTSRTLGGDIVLQTLESRIRATIFRDVETEFGPKKLSDIGIQFQRDGLLSLDEGKFSSALAENYQVPSQILTGHFTETGKTKGFIDHMTELTDTVLRVPDGLLQSRRRSLQTNIDQIDRRIEQRERTLEQKERNLKDRFSRLEGTISRIQGQGAGIAGLAAQAGPALQLG
jgi:flagellar hook-associated protein 2